MTKPTSKPVSKETADRARRMTAALQLADAFLGSEPEEEQSIRSTTRDVGDYVVPILELLDFPPTHLATVRLLLQSMARRGNGE